MPWQSTEPSRYATGSNVCHADIMPSFHKCLHSGLCHHVQPQRLGTSPLEKGLLPMQVREHEALDKAREVQNLQVGAP